MTNINRGIGLFGGSFDPVHNGHITVAQSAISALGLARLDFVPAKAPWQKSVLTGVEHRIEMLRLACSGIPGAEVNLCEVLREGKTYTIDTLEHMRSLIGPSIPLILVIGADQWKNFNTWLRWREFADLASIAICNRNTARPETTADVAEWSRGSFVRPDEISSRPNGLFCEFTVPAHRASSTTIRRILNSKPRHVALGELEAWLSPRVAGYIAKHNLY